MKTTNWLLCHVHAYEYFGGVTRLLIPDNLKTGVSKKTRYETILNKSYAEILLMKMGIDAPSRNVYNYFITTSGASLLKVPKNVDALTVEKQFLMIKYT